MPHDDDVARAQAEIDDDLAAVRSAHREWRSQFEIEAEHAFAASDVDTRMRLVFHVFRMLGTTQVQRDGGGPADAWFRANAPGKRRF